MISCMMTLPLQTNSGPESVGMESSTIECVEHLMAKCFPGLEYVPVGALKMMPNVKKHFGANWTMGGAHPNCECLALMIADKEHKAYRPLSEYLKVSYKTMIKNLIDWDVKLTPKLDNGFLNKFLGPKGRKLHLGIALFLECRQYVDYGKMMGGSAAPRLLKAFWKKLTTGQKYMKCLQNEMRTGELLQLIILPYEEAGCLESARLVDCPVAFACEDPDTAEVKTLPFCSYFLFKNDILRKSSERWGTTKNPKGSSSDNGQKEPEKELEPAGAAS
jgi:hypothetical protein